MWREREQPKSDDVSVRDREDIKRERQRGERKEKYWPANEVERGRY